MRDYLSEGSAERDEVSDHGQTVDIMYWSPDRSYQTTASTLLTSAMSRVIAVNPHSGVKHTPEH